MTRRLLLASYCHPLTQNTGNRGGCVDFEAYNPELCFGEVTRNRGRVALNASDVTLR